MQGKIGLVEVEKSFFTRARALLFEETMFLTQLCAVAATYPCESILTQLIPAPTSQTQYILPLKTGSAMARTYQTTINHSAREYPVWECPIWTESVIS